MSELSRLIDDRDADPELARLFREGRAPAPLSRVVFERSRKRVLGLAVAPAALGMLAWVQHAALGAALGTTAALVATLPRLLAEPPRVQRALAPPSAAPARSITPSLERRPAPLPSVAPESSVAFEIGSQPAPSATTAEHELVRETRLLEKARAELERRPELGLELLREHSREFPNGVLALEREFLTVATLVRLGRHSEAGARAAALRARTPGSLYEERLERLLGGGATP